MKEKVREAMKANREASCNEYSISVRFYLFFTTLLMES